MNTDEVMAKTLALAQSQLANYKKQGAEKNLKKRMLMACEGKQAFDTFKEAQFVHRRTGKKGGVLQVYRCDCCRKYHIGSSLAK